MKRQDSVAVDGTETTAPMSTTEDTGATAASTADDIPADGEFWQYLKGLDFDRSQMISALSETVTSAFGASQSAGTIRSILQSTEAVAGFKDSIKSFAADIDNLSTHHIAAAANVTSTFADLSALQHTSFISSIPSIDQALLTSIPTWKSDAGWLSESFGAVSAAQEILQSVKATTEFENSIKSFAADIDNLSTHHIAVAANVTSTFADLIEPNLCSFAGLDRIKSMAIDVLKASSVADSWSTFGDFPSSFVGASTLDEAMRTPSFMSAVSTIQKSLASTVLAGPLTETVVSSKFGGLFGDFSVPEPRFSMGPARLATVPPGRHGALEPQMLPTQAVQISSTPASEHLLVSPPVSEAWLRRYGQEIGMFLSLVAIIVALLTWLFPRSTPTTVQVKEVWPVVQTYMAPYVPIGTNLPPVIRVSQQPSHPDGPR